MPRTIWLVTLAVGALLAGCGSDEPATRGEPASSRSTPTDPAPELVTWVDGVCQVERAGLWNPPPPAEPTSVAETDRPAVVAYLTEGRDHFNEVTAMIDRLGAAPVDGGDAVTTTMRSKVNDLAEKLGEYAESASVIPEFDAPYRLALGELASWTFGSPSLDDLAKREPLVARAKERATSC